MARSARRSTRESARRSARRSERKPARSNRKSSRKSGKKKSAYNVYMSKELKKLKAEYPEKSHAERFKMAAANWKGS